MRGFVGILVVLLVALVAGAVGFQAGVVANVGANAGTAVPAYWWWGFPHVGGFLFGFLFLFLIIGLVAFAFGGRRRGPWGRGWDRRGWGYWGYGAMGDPGDPRHQWIADAHRRLHEAEAARASTLASGAGGSDAGASDAGASATGGGDIPPAPPGVA